MVSLTSEPQRGGPGNGAPAWPVWPRLRLTSALCSWQPKQISEIKDFLLTARRKDAKCAPPPWHRG